MVLGIHVGTYRGNGRSVDRVSALLHGAVLRNNVRINTARGRFSLSAFVYGVRAGPAGSNITQRGNMQAKTTESKPTYEQAQLQLRLYEQRRETRLRTARDWFVANYFVNSMEESMRIAAPGTENGTFVMMVFSYWDQTCAMLNYGLLHEDLFFETTGEFFGVWERVRPVIAEGRKMFSNPGFLAHLEKAAVRYEKWCDARSPGQIAAMRNFMEQMKPKTKTA